MSISTSLGSHLPRWGASVDNACNTCGRSFATKPAPTWITFSRKTFLWLVSDLLIVVVLLCRVARVFGLSRRVPLFVRWSEPDFPGIGQETPRLRRRTQYQCRRGGFRTRTLVNALLEAMSTLWANSVTAGIAGRLSVLSRPERRGVRAA